MNAQADLNLLWVHISACTFSGVVIHFIVGHFVSSPREREKRDRRDSRGNEKEGQGGKK